MLLKIVSTVLAILLVISLIVTGVLYMQNLKHEATIARLDKAITKQNSAVDKLASDGKQANSKADISALRTIAKHRKLKTSISSQGSGPKEMNRWFANMFR